MSAPVSTDPEIAYFRDIERAFVERRGDPLFISNADWVFLAKLWKKGVPMRVVLRGMTDAFDAHAHSFARKQKIKSLRFCETEITAAVDRYRRALQSEGPSRRGLSEVIEKLAEALGTVPVPSLERNLRDASARLKEIAKSVDANRSYQPDHDLATVEDLLAEAASVAIGDATLQGIEKATRDATAAYKSRMPAKVYETLIGESIRRKTLQHFGLPRLLLSELQ